MIVHDLPVERGLLVGALFAIRDILGQVLSYLPDIGATDFHLRLESPTGIKNQYRASTLY